MDALTIQPDDPRRADVTALLETHLEFARRVTPPEDVHALDVEGLTDDDITLYSGRVEGDLVAIGALRRLDATHAEIKSMHTDEQHRGEGIGRSMLEHLVAAARACGYRRVSLETGMMDAFAPAREMYLGYGFAPCEPFGDYSAKRNSVCMTLDLDTSHRGSAG